MERVVCLFGSEYNCRSFTNVDPDYSGVEVSLNGEHLGQIVDLEVPDVDDEEMDEHEMDDVKRFEEEVEEWIIDNGF